MSAKAGEVARETGAFRCEHCGAKAMVTHGAVIGDCENCGGASFQTSARRFDAGRNSTSVFNGIT